jgi:hypothetical protein
MNCFHGRVSSWSGVGIIDRVPKSFVLESLGVSLGWLKLKVGEDF